MNPLLIVARIILPLVILWFPLLGGTISVVLDTIDWYTKHLIGIGPIGDYQTIDKALDLYYLSLLAIVAGRFNNKTVRNLIWFFYTYRFFGTVLFEITQMRGLLFIFPNIFENLFFFYYILQSTASYEPKIHILTLGWILVIVTVPKILHEYSIHIIQQQLVIDVFGFLYRYEGTNHQALYLVCISVAFGLFYKTRKKNK